VVNGVFSATPTLYTVNNSNRRKMSLHITPVPEPSEWTMLVAGLLAIGFIAVRRNHGID
jgi:hypothetical protein